MNYMNITPKAASSWLGQIERISSNGATADVKFGLRKMFNYIRQLIQYQIPTPPTEVSEDRHYFVCPRCKQAFESEWTADDFIFCPGCGQRFRETEDEKE